MPTCWLCHVDYGHILGNTFGLCAFGAIIIVRDGFGKFTLLCIFTQLCTGFTWLTRGACGASGTPLASLLTASYPPPRAYRLEGIVSTALITDY